MAKPHLRLLRSLLPSNLGLRTSLRVFGRPKTVKIKMRETCANESYFSFFAIESSPVAQKLILSIFWNLPFWAYKLEIEPGTSPSFLWSGKIARSLICLS